MPELWSDDLGGLPNLPSLQGDTMIEDKELKALRAEIAGRGENDPQTPAILEAIDQCIALLKVAYAVRRWQKASVGKAASYAEHELQELTDLALKNPVEKNSDEEPALPDETSVDAN